MFGGFRKVKKITKSVITASDVKSNTPFYLRPPGAVPEADFIRLCENDCLACLTTCPTYVIQKVQTPDVPEFHTAIIDPRISGCSYCKDFPCIKACPTGALVDTGKPMGVAKVLGSCITKEQEFCEICFHTCPEEHQALFMSKNGVLKVDEKECVGCGSCVSACFISPKAIEIVAIIDEKTGGN